MVTPYHQTQIFSPHSSKMWTISWASIEKHVISISASEQLAFAIMLESILTLKAQSQIWDNFWQLKAL